MKIPLYLRTYCSPFKSLQLKWYFGDVSQGVPYFLPRFWRKDKQGSYKATPLKFGFSSCPLGWKTKYDDFRFEFAPRWSFVAFGYQLTLTFYAENEDQYWESFLAFYYETDKSLSWQERIDDCRERFPQVWTKYISGGKAETTDYWDLILCKKYLK